MFPSRSEVKAITLLLSSPGVVAVCAGVAVMETTCVVGVESWMAVGGVDVAVGSGLPQAVSRIKLIASRMIVSLCIAVIIFPSTQMKPRSGVFRS